MRDIIKDHRLGTDFCKETAGNSITLEQIGNKDNAKHHLDIALLKDCKDDTYIRISTYMQHVFPWQ